jgi:hypothetical protein
MRILVDATVFASAACCRNRAARATPVTQSGNPFSGSDTCPTLPASGQGMGASPAFVGFLAVRKRSLGSTNRYSLGEASGQYS